MAQNSQGSEIDQHYGRLQPMESAFERFRITLSYDERANFAHDTLDSVIFEVLNLEKRQATSSITRNIACRLEPLVTFLDRYSRAFDCLVQVYPNPCALIWGTLRILMQIAGSYSEYLEKLVCMIEKINDTLSIYSQYEQLFLNVDRFQVALADTYYSTLLFLYKAKSVFAKPGFQIFHKSIWKTLEIDFRDTLRALSRHNNILNNEILLANSKSIDALLKEQRNGSGAANRILAEIKDPWQARRNIMSWLAPPDTQGDFLRESNRRTQPCGQWLFDHDVFKNWLQMHNESVLWIIGSPGSGKTVLSTSVVEHIRRERNDQHLQLTTFFYYSRNIDPDQTGLPIMTSLISQILAQLEEIPPNIVKSYNSSIKYGRLRMSMVDQPLTLLKSLCGFFSDLYVIMDGLDEACSPEEIVKMILEIIESSRNVHVVIFSRDIPKLNRLIGSYPIIRIRPGDTTADINAFLLSQVQQLGFDNAIVQEKILPKLCQKADGMFLWANLMINYLKSATSLHDAMEIVSDLPIGLEHTYSLILKDMSKASFRRQMLFKKILAWVCYSARPLHWDELQCIFAIDETNGKVVQSKLPFKAAILELCSSLVEYLPDCDTFRLAHSSVREFLSSSPEEYRLGPEFRQFSFQEIDGHSELAGICLAYLLHLGPKVSLNIEASKFPMADYAALYWGYHVVRSRYSSSVEEKMRSYLSSEPRRLNWMVKQLFWGSSVFPLQSLIKMQRQFQEWTSKDDSIPNSHQQTSWMSDVGRILLEVEEIEEERASVVGCDATGNSRISYFEKLMVIRDLSREYTMRSKLGEAENLMGEALATERLRFGTHHLATVWLLSSLGIIYDQQQRVDLAVETHEKALSIQESILGPDHLETIWTVNELGRVYRHLNRYDDSERMHLRALQILRQSLSEDDLQVAWTMNTLARTYRKRRLTAKAIELHESAIAIQRKTLEDDHPHVLWAMTDIARCHHDDGKLRLSADMHRVCLEGRKRVLGVRHVDTLWSMNDLALVLAELGKFNEAKELHEQALSGQVLLLGETHPHAVWTKEALTRLND